MSTEAADYLLQNGPDKKGRDAYNLYYWYYGTLAMYQQGGDAWTKWNDRVRDQIVRRQQLEGHRAGSWDPDDSDYGPGRSDLLHGHGNAHLGSLLPLPPALRGAVHQPDNRSPRR